MLVQLKKVAYTKWLEARSEADKKKRKHERDLARKSRMLMLTTADYAGK